MMSSGLSFPCHAERGRTPESKDPDAADSRSCLANCSDTGDSLVDVVGIDIFSPALNQRDVFSPVLPRFNGVQFKSAVSITARACRDPSTRAFALAQDHGGIRRSPSTRMMQYYSSFFNSASKTLVYSKPMTFLRSTPSRS
jgi:hypothetical protein